MVLTETLKEQLHCICCARLRDKPEVTNFQMTAEQSFESKAVSLRDGLQFGYSFRHGLRRATSLPEGGKDKSFLFQLCF